MKFIPLKTILLIITFLVFDKSQAQFSIAASASYLKGTGKNKVQIFGGGLAAGYAFTHNINVGIAYHFYPVKNSTKASANNGNVTYKDETSNIAATFTYFLSTPKRTYSPYVGLDAGVCFSKQSISFADIYNPFINGSQKATNILLSPKLGLQYSFAKKIGLFIQAQYHFLPNKEKQKLVGYVATTGQPIVLSPVQQFFTGSLGIVYRFYKH